MSTYFGWHWTRNLPWNMNPNGNFLVSSLDDKAVVGDAKWRSWPPILVFLFAD